MQMAMAIARSLVAAIDDCQHVEFTDEGDVVIATRRGATAYSATTLEPVRSWTWLAGVRHVQAIQAHRGLLRAALTIHKYDTEAQLYE